MSRSARFTGVFGDGKHDFLLDIGRLEELQEKTDCGPEELWRRIIAGTWKVQDLRETLRLGLIGGGMDSTKALILVERYANTGDLAGLKPLVQGIIGAALIGAPDEDAPPEGESEAGETTTGSPAAS